MVKREFLTWAESVVQMQTDDEGLRQMLAFGRCRDLRAFVLAKERPFLATFESAGIALSDGDEGICLYSRWDSDEPTRLTDGRTLPAWGGRDNFCEWEKQETPNERTGYAAVYLLWGFLCIHPWSLKRAAEQGYCGGLDVSPPSWWDKAQSPVPFDESGRPMVQFCLIGDNEMRHRAPPAELHELWFRTVDIERIASGGELTKKDKPMDARERVTLLCIIGALAQHANLDLSQPMKAGEAIAAMMPDVKVSARTIGEHLKAVGDAMDSRKG